MLKGRRKRFRFPKKNTTLEKVFKELHKKTGYEFFYRDEVLQKAKKFDIKVVNATIEEVLERCFQDQPLNYSIANNVISIKEKEPERQPVPLPPPVDVKGTVYDEKGKPLAGVSIIVVGEKKGVSTDDKGNFLISVSENAVLSFSYIGYKTVTVPVKGKNSIEITLSQDVASIDDVVVVGYGQQKKITTIGAQATVKVAELKQPVGNLTTVIAGRIAGVIGVQRSGEPGYDNAEVWIRGISTFTNSSPLVLVDGVERSFNNIDPEDIESFSILKDASATAVYGVRGANGVILITLKKGKMGAPVINFQINQGITQFTKVPEFADGVTYMRMANEAYKNSNPNAVNPLYSDDAIKKKPAMEVILIYIQTLIGSKKCSTKPVRTGGST